MPIVKEPFIHFLVMGLLIFAYFEAFPTSDADTQIIIIDQQQIQRLRESWVQTWRRPPNQQELANLVESTVIEEIYYREALQLGLDQNDSVVRNRMIQKMRYMHSEELPEPTHDDLLNTLRLNGGKYDSEALYSFQQAYLGQGYDVVSAAELVNKLNATTVTPKEISESLNMPNSFVEASAPLIEGQLGAKFADTITAGSYPESEWFGPVVSGFGWHLVKVTNVQEGSVGLLSNTAVRQRVENDWRAKQGQILEERIFTKLRKKYSVEISIAE